MNKWTPIVAVLIATSALVLSSSIDTIESQLDTIDVFDSTTILLDFKKLEAGDYMILYSSGPKIITSGNIVAKLPCDENSDPKDWMLIGGVGTDLSSFQPIEVQLTQGNPGSMCAYGANILGEYATISVVVMVNNGGDAIRLPRTSTIIVTVHALTSQ